MFVSPRKWIRSGLGWIQEILDLTSRLSRNVAPTLHCVLEKKFFTGKRGALRENGTGYE